MTLSALYIKDGRGQLAADRPDRGPVAPLRVKISAGIELAGYRSVSRAGIGESPMTFVER